MNLSRIAAPVLAGAMVFAQGAYAAENQYSLSFSGDQYRHATATVNTLDQCKSVADKIAKIDNTLSHAFCVSADGQVYAGEAQRNTSWATLKFVKFDWSGPL